MCVMEILHEIGYYEPEMLEGRGLGYLQMLDRSYPSVENQVSLPAPVSTSQSRQLSSAANLQKTRQQRVSHVLNSSIYRDLQLGRITVTSVNVPPMASVRLNRITPPAKTLEDLISASDYGDKAMHRLTYLQARESEPGMRCSRCPRSHP